MYVCRILVLVCVHGYVCVFVCVIYVPLVSTGVLVLLVTILGARSRDISLNGSTVVDTLLQIERQLAIGVVWHSLN